MIKEIVTYPDERIKITSADVRKFDEELFALIDNMKETMSLRGIDALSAIQIAVPATVVVIHRDDGSFLELINPRIIHTDGTVPSVEETLYLPGIPATLKRYDRIKLIYQDRSGAQKSMEAEGELSIRIQRKIDYTFGGTILDKLEKKEQKRVEKEARKRWGQPESGSCPSVFYRDYFTAAIRYLLIALAATLLVPFFTDSPDVLENVYFFDMWATAVLLLLITGYFFYAQHEARASRSCTSCQSGNIIGTSAVALLKTVILYTASYLWINPS